LEYEQLEKDIAHLEAERNKITALLNSSTDNHDDVVKWSEQIGDIISQLDEKSLRWLELSEGV
jgi:ATP-binding cassette subfamily F protein uup